MTADELRERIAEYVKHAWVGYGDRVGLITLVLEALVDALELTPEMVDVLRQQQALWYKQAKPIADAIALILEAAGRKP